MATQSKVVIYNPITKRHEPIAAGDTISSDKIASKPWAMFRSTTTTAANGVVPLVLRGQDATNAHMVFGGVVDLLAGRTYIISAGLPNDPSTALKSIVIQRSIDGGATWATVWGSGLSGATGGNSATASGTSVTDVYTTTVPTKLRVTAGTNILVAGVWLLVETK